MTKVMPVANVRNFVILGHSGSGKTTLTDLLAFKLGINDRQGFVDNGTSVSDYTDEEKTRKISIFACPFMGDYKSASGADYRLVFTDTPGYMDFYGQVFGAVRASDAALITVDATGGVQVGTRRAWQACQAGNLQSRGFVVTGLDKENASFDKALAAIQAAFGPNCVPVVVPAGGGKMVDLLAAHDLSPELQEIKGKLVEAAAETDDTLIAKFLAGEKLTAAEIATGLVHAVADGKFYPVFAATPLKDAAGVTETIEGICHLFPCPGSRTFKDAAGKELKPDPAAPFVGQVWRTLIDPFIGQVSYVRVISGTLVKGDLVNTSTGAHESAGAIITTVGKKQATHDHAGPGEIVAIPKLKATKTGHTLAAAGQTTQVAPLNFPNPVMYMAITAKTQADEDKMGTAIHRLCDQDPTLHVEKNAETKEVVLKGLGDVHIDVAVKLMKQNNVNVDLSTPKVPYRETVTALGEGHYKHKKQTGGRGQFGEVYLRVDPLHAGEKEWFLDEVVGGTIPNNFKPAVHKGVVEGMLAGSVAGYPVQGVKVHMYDGSYHDVDSSEIAFKIAAMRAFRDAMSKAHPVLLEPIMTIKVSVPEHYMGTINGDLTHKRGHVLGLEPEHDMQVITAEAPLSELFKYAAELRSMTGGQGSFDMTFARYAVVPANVAQKVIAEAAKHRKVEEEE